MRNKVAITVHRSRDEVERLWRDPSYRPAGIQDADATMTMKRAPGDRGTEIHLELVHGVPGGMLGEAVEGLFGGVSRAKAKDALRRFKQLVETGEIPRSDAVPEGEKAERKLRQRPAQPLEAAGMGGVR